MPYRLVSISTTPTMESSHRAGMKRAATAPNGAAAMPPISSPTVASVNTIVSKGKSKRWKGQAYQRSDSKKAIVTLAAGQDPIDITEGAPR